MLSQACVLHCVYMELERVFMFLLPLPTSLPILSLSGDQRRWSQHVASLHTSHHQWPDVHKDPASEGGGCFRCLPEAASAS